MSRRHRQHSRRVRYPKQRPTTSPINSRTYFTGGLPKERTVSLYFFRLKRRTFLRFGSFSQFEMFRYADEIGRKLC